jgi:hypothetical protein
MGSIRLKAPVKIGEPLCVDEGLQYTPDFEPVVRPAQTAQCQATSGIGPAAT